MKDIARKLRHNQTDAEKLIWSRIRDRRLAGYKFRRQHLIQPYIVDFFCEDKNLIVEIDGGQHTPEIDEERTSFLESKGFRIIRFWNNEVLTNIEGVLETIVTKLEEPKAPHPHPLPKGEGVKRVCLGKIVGAHGVKGLVKILPFGEDVTLLEKLRPLYIHAQGDETMSIALKNAVGQYWLAAVEGITEKNGADDLRGTEFWVEKSALPKIKEAGTYYQVDLIGLSVIDENGAEIGSVANVLNYGAGDLLEIRFTGGPSSVIPFTDRYVAKVEIGKGITVTAAIKEFEEL